MFFVWNLQRLQLGQPVEGAVLQRLELVVVQGPEMCRKLIYNWENM